MVTPSEYATVMFGLAALALTLLVWAFVARRVVHRQFFCPWKKADADVKFVTARFSRKPVDVLSCSLFSKDETVDCGKMCLNLFLPKRYRLKRSYRNKRKEGQRIEWERDVRRWLF